MSPTPSLSSEMNIEARFTAAGVPLEAVSLADFIASFTTDVDPQICLWADVVAVFVAAAMIGEILDQGHESYTKGMDFGAVSSLLREAADKYDAIGKRVAN